MQSASVAVGYERKHVRETKLMKDFCPEHPVSLDADYIPHVVYKE